MSARVRLDRALSKLGIASRSEAQLLIRDGQVSVAGRTQTDPAALVIADPLKIEVVGKRNSARAWRTIALNNRVEW